MIGEMYQFSLEYFNALFLLCIQKARSRPTSRRASATS